MEQAAPSIADEEPPGQTAAFLREFLERFGGECPDCGAPLPVSEACVCPRCKLKLALTLDPRPIRFGWYIVMFAPLIITWGITFILLVVSIAFGDVQRGGPYSICVVGVGDLIVAAGLWEHRRAMLAASLFTQRLRAGISWATHIVLAFCVIGLTALF